MEKKYPDYLTAESASCRSCCVTFSILGKDVKGDRVTSLLGLTPTFAFDRGDWVKTSTGAEFTRPVGHWAWSTEMLASNNAEVHARLIVDTFYSKKNAIDFTCEEMNAETAVRITWRSKDGDGGYSLHPDTVSRLTELCGVLHFAFL